MKSYMNIHPLLKIMNNSLVVLPSPVNISSHWNFGFLLSFCLVFQIASGLFLSMHYCSDITLAFMSIDHILRDINYGWLMRIFHSNTASIFFFCMYIHIARGIYYESFFLLEVWNIGVIIFLLSMATAFLGYVLPWGQMSLWGATVITNLFSVIPYIGNQMVQWLWGGFSVDCATLMRFFSFHFILPFLILSMVMIHLLFLHQTGSSNSLGVNSNLFKVTFHPFFLVKDLLALSILIFVLSILVFFFPWILADPENFIPANPLVTPIHIQPEWYFLFAYAILRSVPNKTGGVLALLASIFILFIIPLMNMKKMKGNMFYPISKFLFWTMVGSIFVLTWIGMRPVEGSFIIIGQMSMMIYFFSVFFTPMANFFWEKLL